MKKLSYNLFSIIFIWLFVVILASCSHDEVETRGYVVKFSDFSKIKPGVSTKSDVVQQLGSPTTTSLFGDETWYYVGKEQSKETFFDPEIKDYEGYEISFKGDVVNSIVKKNANDLKDFDISDDYTKTSGNEISVWQQLFGNLGKFNPAAQSNRGPLASGPRGGGI